MNRANGEPTLFPLLLHRCLRRDRASLRYALASLVSYYRWQLLWGKGAIHSWTW